MKKDQLETFIKRYTLGGLVSKVKWKYNPTEKTLHTRAVIDNRSFVVDVIMHDFNDFGDTDLALCIGDTDRLLGMMKPFGEDISMTVNKSGDRIFGFSIFDADCESYCTAADPSAIDPVPKNLNDIPEYQVEVPFTEEFIDKFRAAHSALRDVDTYSVGMNKKGLFEFVVGYATTNANRIRLTPSTSPDKNKLEKALSFPIKNTIEALKINADIPNGLLSINNMGIVRLYFKNDKYSCTYYQFANLKGK